MTHLGGDPWLEARIQELGVTVCCLSPSPGGPYICPFSGQPSTQRVVWARTYWRPPATDATRCRDRPWPQLIRGMHGLGIRSSRQSNRSDSAQDSAVLPIAGGPVTSTTGVGGRTITSTRRSLAQGPPGRA